MAEPSPNAVMLDKLSLLAANTDLSERTRTTALRLRLRLSSPVRLGIFGPSAADSAQLLAVLIDQLVAPCIGVRRQLALVQDAAQLLPDDSNGRELIETPHPLLRGMIVDLFPPVSGVEDYVGVDIALWCTRSFDETEFAAWETAPNALKDHSFLIAFERGRETPPDQIDRLQSVTEDQFSALSLVDLSLGATAADGLRQQLIQRVANGRAADNDHAAFFLQAHQSDLPAETAHVAPASLAAESPSEITELREIGPAPTPPIQDRLVLASRYLQERADLLVKVSFEGDADICSAVLAHCSETAETLADMFAQDRAGTEGLCAFRNDLLTAADGIVLMSLEESITSALEAVTVLLQIKKDLKMQVAA